MRSYVQLLLLTLLASLCVAAQEPGPVAEFLFIGTYHMSNPGRDVHNTKADDVLAAKRQREIAEVVMLIERYHPTKVMIEADTASQAKINQNFLESCKGARPLTGNETEQLGFRIACDMKLNAVYAVDWNELGPIRDEESVDYRAAVERNHQQKQYEAHLAIGKKEAEKQQLILDRGTILNMLTYLNSQPYLKQNARAYFRSARRPIRSEPIGYSSGSGGMLRSSITLCGRRKKATAFLSFMVQATATFCGDSQVTPASIVFRIQRRGSRRLVNSDSLRPKADLI